MTTIAAAKKPPLFPRLYPTQNIRVLQAQFFDNSAAQPKKGQSQFALKLFAWSSGTVDFKKHEWWRVVQLLEPFKVHTWAKAKLSAGEMTADQFAQYDVAYQSACEMIATGSRCWMGHIGSPPGKQYFVGQFVLVRLDEDDTMRAMIFNDDDSILLDGFKQPRKRGRIVMAGSPKLVALHDPMGVLERQEAIKEANETGRTLADVLQEREEARANG